MNSDKIKDKIGSTVSVEKSELLDGIHSNVIKELLEDRGVLVFPQINLNTEKGKNYIEIVVDPSKNPVSYHGHFYYRSGSTIQDLSGGALEQFLLAKRGKKWDGVIAENFSMDDLSENAFTIFRKKAIKSFLKRLTLPKRIICWERLFYASEKMPKNWLQVHL